MKYECCRCKQTFESEHPKIVPAPKKYEWLFVCAACDLLEQEDKIVEGICLGG